MTLHAMRLPRPALVLARRTPAEVLTPSPAAEHHSMLPTCGGGTLRPAASQRALAEAMRAGHM